MLDSLTGIAIVLGISYAAVVGGLIYKIVKGSSVTSPTKTSIPSLSSTSYATPSSTSFTAHTINLTPTPLKGNTISLPITKSPTRTGDDKDLYY